ncbi:MAG: aminoacyl-tRNA hydrolase [Alphaproteobacteria bacterium]|nr:aminoacyl-tRNA hydrolase [Alphaproteobacteria bacterium]
MFLVVGLGNPGAEYANTRHNVGFMAADEIHRRYNFSAFRAKFSGLIAEGNINGEKVYLLKPQTYMNLSGNSVVQAANFYKILPQNIVVIHDDMDLPTDKMKAKIGGGSGGHNGIKSIDSCITPNYNRIRIGVGHPAGKSEENVVNHVLSGFSKQDKENVEANIDLAADMLPLLLEKGIAEFSNQLGMKLAKNGGQGK